MLWSILVGSVPDLLLVSTVMSVRNGMTLRIQCRLPNIIGMFSDEVLCIMGNTISEKKNISIITYAI